MNINESEIISNFNVFTDGSALKNSTNSSAGFASYFDKLNKLFSKSMIGTNNQAELEAISFSLWYINKNYELFKNLIKNNIIYIYTDSQYSINVLTGKNTPSKNIEKINRCKNLIKNIQALSIEIKFIHVMAHTNQSDYLSKCNDLVDKAAREKAKKK